MKPHSRHLLQASGPHLTRLVQRAQALDRLAAAVRALLTPVLSSHCRGVSLNDRSLTIFVDNPVWTTRVRFYQNDIRNGLKRQFKTDVRHVRVKVMPRRFAQSPPRNEPRRLSAATRDLLRTTADGIDDPELAEALRRLGRKSS